MEPLSDGLYWNEEIDLIGGGYSPNYTDEGNEAFPPTPGKSYHGRGPFQLSWNYNYGQVSQMFLGDKHILLDHPEYVVAGGWDKQWGYLGWLSAIWFWMTPQYPKGSMHEVMTDTWVPLRKEDASVFTPGFGLTIVIINGGFEAGCAEGQNGAVDRRIAFYRKFAQYTNADLTGEKVDTADMPPWT